MLVCKLWADADSQTGAGVELRSFKEQHHGHGSHLGSPQSISACWLNFGRRTCNILEASYSGLR